MTFDLLSPLPGLSHFQSLSTNVLDFTSVLTEVVLNQNISKITKMQRGTFSHPLMYLHFQLELIDFFERLLGFCPR